MKKIYHFLLLLVGVLIVSGIVSAGFFDFFKLKKVDTAKYKQPELQLSGPQSFHTNPKTCKAVRVNQGQSGNEVCMEAGFNKCLFGYINADYRIFESSDGSCSGDMKFSTFEAGQWFGTPIECDIQLSGDDPEILMLPAFQLPVPEQWQDEISTSGFSGNKNYCFAAGNGFSNDILMTGKTKVLALCCNL